MLDLIDLGQLSLANSTYSFLRIFIDTVREDMIMECVIVKETKVTWSTMMTPKGVNRNR